MKHTDPANYVWWLSGRAAGIVALAIITASVVLGLMSAAGLFSTPGLKKVLVKTHEYLSVTGLVMILTHGLLFLPDKWLHPGVAGIFVPGAISYRPLFVASGILAAYMAAVLGLSFYARRRVGVKRWRSLHRLIIVAWALAMVHAFGAGTDSQSIWLFAVLVGCALPVVFFFIARSLPKQRAQARARAAQPENEAWGFLAPAPDETPPR